MSSFLEKHLGSIIAQKRVNLGLSQEKLANMCDLDRSYLSRIERGLLSPTISKLHTICKALKVKMSEVLEEIEVEIGRS